MGSGDGSDIVSPKEGAFGSSGVGRCGRTSGLFPRQNPKHGPPFSFASCKVSSGPSRHQPPLGQTGGPGPTSRIPPALSAAGAPGWLWHGARSAREETAGSWVGTQLPSITQARSPMTHFQLATSLQALPLRLHCQRVISQGSLSKPVRAGVGTAATLGSPCSHGRCLPKEATRCVLWDPGPRVCRTHLAPGDLSDQSLA